MGLRNVKFAPTGVPTISEMVGMAAQAVGNGVYHTFLLIDFIFPHSANREASDTHCRAICA
jgi:hypothetical protein